MVVQAFFTSFQQPYVKIPQEKYTDLGVSVEVALPNMVMLT